MDKRLRNDADYIIKRAIEGVLPDAAVKKALTSLPVHSGRTFLVAAGKAAWQMASAACEEMDFDKGIVITKYGHVKGELPGITCFEAGHPVPDQNGFDATREALLLTSDLSGDDLVVFLLSGGGSALFEDPLVPAEKLVDITKQLLDSGASITEMNAVRKRLSGVKGGRFALHCMPARVFCVVLSDILGDPVDMIASGPVSPDPSTCEEALEIAERYGLKFSGKALKLLSRETSKEINNAEIIVTGSVSELCRAAALACRDLGYEPLILTDRMSCEAREAGCFLALQAIEAAERMNLEAVPECSKASEHMNFAAGQMNLAAAKQMKKTALIAGGETVVHITGSGLGGRNQEIALSAAKYIDGQHGIAVFSVGSDGTDGPTDAAGGYADGDTMKALRIAGIDFEHAMKENDSYHALKAAGGLIMTGPTGTNVNDGSIALVCPQDPEQI